MFGKNIDLRLSTKGRILVAIPLTVQIVSVVLLSLLLNNAESQTARVQRSREIANQTLLIAKLMYDAGYALFADMETIRQTGSRDMELAAEYSELAKQIPDDLTKLERLVTDRPREKTIVDGFIDAVRRQLKGFGKIRKAVDENRLTVAYAAATIISSGTPMNQMSSRLRELTSLQSEDGKLLLEATRSRESLPGMLYASVAMNVAVVIFLMVLFNRDTISRLNTLMENTRRFAQGHPLNAPLDGRDEIAELDRVFQEVVNEVQASRARERELMEIKKQIVAMVSHDLRTPLSSLQATLKLLSENAYGGLSPDARDRVARSERSVKRLIKMINDLLDLEKLEAGKMEMRPVPLPLPAIINRSIEAVEALASAKEISLLYDQGEFEVLGDGERLIQVLVNLLSNAIKFSPDGSPVDITTREQSGFVQVKITDRGPGVPESYRKKIFDRYEQVDAVASQPGKQGTGLGLAICRIIVEQHGGQIGVEPGEEGGSSFWFTIPVSEDSAVEDPFSDQT